ncbi:MAG: lysophospholipase [Solobacterium sp.]|nr:lysophospholipase [Solobacterium sp.]
MENITMTIFRPQQAPKAVVEIIHGMAEHRKRYEDFANYLKAHNYVVVTFDLPGHGEATKESDLGYFGETQGWNRLLQAVDQVCEELKKEYPNIPFYLFGHSMGSMLARCYLQQHDDKLDGLILSGAPNYQSATKLGILVGKLLKLFKGSKGHSSLMDGLVTGGFNKVVSNPKTPYDWISYNPENVKKYAADARCGFGFTLQGYIDELSGLDQLHQSNLYQCKKKDLPILFIVGEDDPCTGGEKGLADSIGTLKEAGYQQIEKKLYPDMRHEILNEVNHERVYEDTLNWLDAQVGKI